MEPVTHLLFGIGLTSLSPSPDISLSHPICIATALGAIAPDMDIVFRFGGELLYLKHHRGMTHSLLGMVILSVVITMCMKLFLPLNNIGEIFLWALLGCISHVFLDALNSHGIKLFYPFSRKYTALNLLLIYDPLIIIVSLLMFFGKRFSNLAVSFGVILLVVYFFARFYYRQKIYRYLRLKYRRKNIIKIIIMPSLTSLLYWDFVVETQNKYFIGSIRTFSKKFNLKRKLKKHSKNMLVKMAMKTKLASLFREFTPYFHIEHFKKNDKHFVRFHDLRYFWDKEFLHSATAIFDHQFTLVDAFFQPFSKNRKIKLLPENQ